MDSASKIFKALALIGQLTVLFPFAVMSAAAGGEAPEVWRFAAIFAIWALFRFFGFTAGSLAEKVKGGNASPKLHPLINFLARSACVIPLAAFVAACVIFSLPTTFYFYILPPSVVIYFAGYSSVGRNYSDVFTIGWFVIYPISALLFSIMMYAGKISAPWAGNALSVGFAVEILLLVFFMNQKNIDKCTQQRDAGKAVLPRGLRRYNAVIVIVIFTLSLGLFIFAETVGQILMTAVAAVIGAVLFVVDLVLKLLSAPDDPSERFPDGEGHMSSIPALPEAGVRDYSVALIIVVGAILIIAFRKPIWGAIKKAFAAAFKNRDKSFDTPYVDELMSSDAKPLTPREVKKAERELAKKYARETSPALRYRMGYALFLARLRHTQAPPAPSDTTEVHREKGERAFGVDLSELSKTYDKVRYADAVPTAEELEAQAEIIRSLSGKKQK